MTRWTNRSTAPDRRRTSLKAAGTPALLGALVAGSSALAAPLGISDFGQLALRCAPSAAPSTPASTAQAESAFEPLAVNGNTMATSGVPAARDVAMQLATKLLEAGHSVDIGIMQINSADFQKPGLTLEAAFDPCKSIAAAVLKGNFAGGGEIMGASNPRCGWRFRSATPGTRGAGSTMATSMRSSWRRGACGGSGAGSVRTAGWASRDQRSNKPPTVFLATALTAVSLQQRFDRGRLRCERVYLPP